MARPPRTLDQGNYEAVPIGKRDDGAAVITFNRPERHNAVSGPMHSELAQRATCRPTATCCRTPSPPRAWR